MLPNAIQASPLATNRRKKVRKGTKSCWECKRRKIKCVYPPGNDSVCINCRDKGCSCLSQEYHDEQSLRDDAVTLALGRRMERVEMLLENLIESDSRRPRGASSCINAVRPLSLSPSRFNGDSTFSSSSVEIPGQEAKVVSLSPPGIIPTSTLNQTTSACQNPPISKKERTRRQLAALLPCQEDATYLFEKGGWWLLQRHIIPDLLGDPDIVDDHYQVLPEVSAISLCDSVIIARFLLCVALCIQQLSSAGNLRNLQNTTSALETMEDIISLVTSTVISDDELISSVEGLQCLVLHAAYHINAGNLRRSWLTFRRAVSIAQLMGFHRLPMKDMDNLQSCEERRGYDIWFQIMRGERFLSLMLGVPSATAAIEFSMDRHGSSLLTEKTYNRHLCEIAGLVLTRNHGQPTHAFSATHDIDVKLELLAKKMPSAWWKIPTISLSGMDEESGSQLERILCQIWHFELEALIHLPFMLRASTDQRYNYSRMSCLGASRELISRWMFLRNSHNTIFVNTLVEFQAFTAVVTILLGILGTASSKTDLTAIDNRHDDLELVDTVVRILEDLEQRGAGVPIVNQGIMVIRTLQDVIKSGYHSSVNLRLEIQHFGTINITRSGRVQSLSGERILGANSGSSTSPAQNALYETQRAYNSPLVASCAPTILPISVPDDLAHQHIDLNEQDLPSEKLWLDDTMLQFTSTQFPMFEAQIGDANTECLSMEDNNVLRCNGLLDTDIGIDWNF